MSIIAMYTTKCTRLVHTNGLVLLGMITLLLIIGVRLVPLGFIQLITLVTSVTLFYLFLYSFSSNFWDWSHSVVKTIDPQGVVVAEAKDAWEVAALITEGLECSAMHRYKMVKGKWSSKHVEHWLALTSTNVIG